VTHKALWFIAIVPPEDVIAQVRDLQHEIAERFGPRRALALPPHITMEAPFRYPEERWPNADKLLKEFFRGEASFEIVLRNFGSFRDDVIFLEVVPNLALLELHGRLSSFMRGEAAVISEPPLHPAYTPHMTIANRDVTPRAHHLIWQEFNTRKFFARFAVAAVSLLRHDGKNWHIQRSYPLRENDAKNLQE
jgi:2'-5' RNA ligase